MWDALINDGLDRIARLGGLRRAPETVPASDAGTGAPVVLVGGMATTEAGLAVLRDGLERDGHPVTTQTTHAGLGCAGEAVDEIVATARIAADRTVGPSAWSATAAADSSSVPPRGATPTPSPPSSPSARPGRPSP